MVKNNRKNKIQIITHTRIVKLLFLMLFLVYQKEKEKNS